MTFDWPERLPVHPHQLEVQEFESYALVVDVRSAKAYAQDHIPEAISLPVRRWFHRGLTEAPAVFAVVPESLPVSAGDPVLVYCDRGGLDATLVARELEARGCSVTVLAGGWPNYRRWVDFGLDTLGRLLSWRWLRSPPVSGVSPVLDAVADTGRQVVDLGAVARQSLMPGFTLPSERLSQGWFESLLLDAVRRFDPAEPVWISEISPGLAPLLPATWLAALESAPVVELRVPLTERCRVWAAELPGGSSSLWPELAALPVPDPGALARWQGLPVEQGLAAVLSEFVDPRHALLAGSDLGGARTVWSLPSLEPEVLAACVEAWLR